MPHYEILCPFHVASVFKLTQMSHVPANVATRLPSRTYEPRLMNSALSLGFGSVGSVGGNYSGTKLHSLFSAILVVATELLLLLLPAACVGVCESGRVCLCSALQSLLLVFSAAPTQFTVHSGMAQCKCCSELKGIK